jgi:lipoyl(octanoyl) transferase
VIVPVLALDRLSLDLPGYLSALHDVLVKVCREADAAATTRPGASGVWARGRLMAHVGVAVHDWVAYFGAAINIDPDLELYRRVRCDGSMAPMTSLSRERRSPVRPALVRQRLVDAFAERFSFDRTSIFHYHAALARTQVQHEFAFRSA